MRVMIVGRGRAGQSFASALGRVGVDVVAIAGSGDDRIDPDGADVVLLCVPDDAIADVAARVVAGDTVVAHCAGSLGLDVLGDHEFVGSVHPLMSLPDAEVGAARLLDRCTMAIAGDHRCRAIVELLGGRPIEVPDDARAIYHAAACVAANHLVVLAAQVERLAAAIDTPSDAYWRLMTTTLDNVVTAGAAGSLTGPAARGDLQTIERHLAALPEAERSLYATLAEAARAMADDHREV